MITDRRFEHDLPDLLARARAARTPDYRDDIVRQTAGMRQRPAWTFPERWLPVSVITSRAHSRPRPVRWRVVVPGRPPSPAHSLCGLADRRVARATARAGTIRTGRQRPGRILDRAVTSSRSTPRRGTRHAIVTGAAPTSGPEVLARRDPARIPPDDGDRLRGRSGRRRRTQPGRHPDGATGRRGSLDLVAGWSIDRRGDRRQRGDTGSLWMVDTAAGTIRKVDGVVTDYEEVQWRPPDGRQLMVTERASDRARFALVSAVDDAVEVLPTVGDAAGGLRPGGWSPDGRRFVFAAQDGQVHVLDMQGGSGVLIRPSLGADGAGYPRFSNDGRRVLMMEYTSGDPTWLSVGPSDGARRRSGSATSTRAGSGRTISGLPTTARSPSCRTWVRSFSSILPAVPVDATLDDRRGRVLAAPRALTPISWWPGGRESPAPTPSR